MNNPSSYCGLVDARISASDKVLPVIEKLSGSKEFKENILWSCGTNQIYK